MVGCLLWAVEYRSDVLNEDELGKCCPFDSRIYIRPGLDAMVELQTFYHELMHVLFFTLGRKRLNKDEYLIDAMGGLLAQFYHSVEIILQQEESAEDSSDE
jgi:hypothetical protein